MFGFSKRERAEREIKEIQKWIVGQSLVQAGNFEAPFQMAVMLEACAFFLHAVSRLSCRPRDEKLRELVLDSSVRQMVNTFSEMVRLRSKKMDTPSLAANMLSLFNTRELEYGVANTLLGEKFDDRNSAVWLAACQIGAAADIPDRDIRLISIVPQLTNSLVAMDLARRIQRVESNLVGKTKNSSKST